MNTLSDFGWTEKNTQDWDSLELTGLLPARVVADFGTSLKLATPDSITAELSGKLAHYTRGDETPKIGDWVAYKPSDTSNAVVESVVLRRNEIARKVAGRQSTKQIIAANVDIAFVILAVGNDFSIERLERFLYQLSISDISPVIVLNKSDTIGDIQYYTEQLSSFNLPIIICSAIHKIGISDINERILPGMTAVLLGSSGVGKSTLTNQLLGKNIQQTSAVRESDSTGKHTTVHRELFILPKGGLLIDTPGIRELQLWGTEEDLDAKYSDITELSSQCKYPDCTHNNESGCAIRKALQNGKLDKSHYANYLKMKAELSQLSKHTARRHQKNNKRPRVNIEWDDDNETQTDLY
jgi:ribosome biogenesis GTPase